MNLRYAWILPAALVLSACGRAERKEAVTFCQFLAKNQAALAATNALEKEALEGTRIWCGLIVANGSGRGADLKQNADSATSLAQSASLVSTQLGQFRQALYDLPLKKDNLQTIRSDMLNQIMKRQKTLQDVRSALGDATTNFLEFQQSRAYVGDTYPASIGRLNTMLESYKGPDDLFGKTIADLKTKYKIQDADLAAGPTT